MDLTNCVYGNFNRIVVRIDSWDINSQYPNGHFVRSIGCIGDIEVLYIHVLC